MTKALVICLTSVGIALSGWASVPVNGQFSAIRKLEGISVPDVNRMLSETEKHNLSRMFVVAYVMSVRRDHESQPISTGLPVYRLLSNNFPEVKKREIEAGALIFLAAIVYYINSLPEYTGDVDRVLQQGISPRNCK